MTSPFFSIIIPTLNQRESFFTLIGLIENQSFQDFELIIVAQVNKLSINKLKYHKNLANKLKIINLLTSGLSAAKNVGLLNSSGRFIYFIDDDCSIDHNFLMNAYELINTYSLDILFGAVYDNNIYHKNVLKIWPKKNKFNLSIIYSIYLTSSVTIFYKARILKKFTFDESFGLNSYFCGNEDVDLIIRILKSGCILKSQYSPDLSVYHPRFEPSNIYSSSFGSVIAKNFNVMIFIYFLFTLLWNFSKSFYYFIFYDFYKSRIFFQSIFLRISGFFKFLI